MSQDAVAQPARKPAYRLRPNDVCWCLSGKKYKRCCYGSDVYGTPAECAAARERATLLTRSAGFRKGALIALAATMTAAMDETLNEGRRR